MRQNRLNHGSKMRSPQNLMKKSKEGKLGKSNVLLVANGMFIERLLKMVDRAIGVLIVINQYRRKRKYRN